MKRCILMVFLLVATCAGAWGIEVREGVMTTAVENRTPVDEVEVFPAADGQLYCFTQVVGAAQPTEVIHFWYRGDELMSRVVLPVKSADWRTWSTKKFLMEWQGEWRVEIQDTQGKVLKTLAFKLI
jgi:hypothetical protein